MSYRDSQNRKAHPAGYRPRAGQMVAWTNPSGEVERRKVLKVKGPRCYFDAVCWMPFNELRPA